ncbi:hypothetical protein CJF30_00002726 [Rutstroemia sp. NJR-2017a BBW]|nr:hypothetical protein CJF30_00002726 [Rutstroemia sp. NJR-2017a BBW]
MLEKDLRPTRYLLTLRYASEFVTEYFEQNPISQLGIIGMRDGIAIRISDISGNPTEHIERLKALRTDDPNGNPSLQNALEMSRAALFHAPSHGTREVLIIYGALLSSDPGDIHDTITNLITDRIRVSIVGLAAQVAICAELCSKTNAGDTSTYSVALNEQHFRELVMAVTTPPVTRTKKQAQSSLLMMGFPSRTLAAGKGLRAADGVSCLWADADIEYAFGEELSPFIPVEELAGGGLGGGEAVEGVFWVSGCVCGEGWRSSGAGIEGHE